MALTHTTTVRNALADLIDDQVNAGSTDASGDLVIMTSSDVTVATIVLSATAFGAASGGTITLGATTNDTNAVGGTAAKFKFQNRNNVEIFRGTVATSGADLNFSSVSIGAGDTVSITSFSYSASA
jgi:hypothetical protein